MSRELFRNWLVARLESAIQPAPDTYPREACAGVLEQIGFDLDKVTVLPDRPQESADVKTVAALVINIPRETGETKNTAETEQIYFVEIDVLWVADFLGDPVKKIPPTFTSDRASAQVWDRLVSAVQRAIRLSNLSLKAPGVLGSKSWELVDVQTSQKCRVVGRMPFLEATVQEPQQAENDVDIFYGATINCSFKCLVSDAPAP